jgi:hypothetical protein
MNRDFVYRPFLVKYPEKSLDIGKDGFFFEISLFSSIT